MNPLPPPVALAAHGPRTSPIFVGHIKSSDARKSSDAAGSKEGRRVHEVQFNYPVSLEGIHVVPNRITPPGMPFMGRTKPDMHTRPFLLEIYGRLALPMDGDAPATGSVQLLLAVTISGGVQWLPLAAPQSNWKLDYLVFGGDFEEVSLILHGDEFKSDEAAEASLNSPLPYPSYYDNMIEVISKLPSGVTARSSSRKPIEIELTPLSTVLAMSLPSEGTVAGVRKLLGSCSTSFANSYIWLSEAAQLVEAIFSYSPRSEPCQSIDDLRPDIEYLEKVNSLLESCWETPRQCLSEDYDAASSCLGEETISILCASVQQLLLSLSQQVAQVCQLPLGRSRQDVQAQVVAYGSELLRCCRLLLTNEFTASEFMISGGMTALCALLYAQPKLPSTLLCDLLLALYYAARHAKIFQNYFYVPLFPQSNPYSPYQMLLYVLASTTKGSALASPSKMLLGMCSYNNALYSLQVLTSQRVGRLVQLATVVTDRCSTGDQVNVTTPWEDAEHIDASGSSGGNNGSGGDALGRLHGMNETHTSFLSACADLVTIMNEIADPMRQLVEAWDRMVAMHADQKNDLSAKCTEDNTIENVLVSALSQGNFLSVVHVVFKVIMLGEECIHAAASNPHLNSMIAACRSLRMNTFAVFARLAQSNKMDAFLSEQDQDQLCSMLEELWSADKLASMASLSLVQSLPLALRSEQECFLPGMSGMDWLLTYWYCSQRANAVFSKLLALCSQLRLAVERHEAIDEQLASYLKYQYIVSHLLAHNTTADLATNLLFYHVFDLIAAVNALLQVVYAGESSHHSSLQAVATFLLSLVQVLINAWDYTGDKDRKKLLGRFFDGLSSIAKAFSSASHDSQKVNSEITHHITKLASFVNHVSSTAALSLEIPSAVITSDKQVTLYLHRLAEVEVSKLDRMMAVQQVDEVLTELYLLHSTTSALAEREELSSNPLQKAYLSSSHASRMQAVLGAVAAASNSHTMQVSVATNILRLQQALVSHLWRIVKLPANHLADLNPYYLDKLVRVLVDIFVMVHEDNTAVGSNDIGFGYENLFHRRCSLCHGILLLLLDFCNRSLHLPAKRRAEDGNSACSLQAVRVMLSYITFRYRLASQVTAIQRPVLALLLSFVQNSVAIVQEGSQSQIVSFSSQQPLALDSFALQSIATCIVLHDSYASEHYSRFYLASHSTDSLTENHVVEAAVVAAQVGQGFSWPKLVVEAVLASSSSRSVTQVVKILCALVSLALSAKRRETAELIVASLLAKARQLADCMESPTKEESAFLMRCLHVLLQSTAASWVVSVLLVQHGMAAIVLQLLQRVVTIPPNPASSGNDAAAATTGAGIAMDTEVSIVAMCLQIVLALHERCMAFLPSTSQQTSTAKETSLPDEEMLANALHVVGLRTAEELVGLLPRILKKYFHSSNSLIQLCLYTFNVLHTEANYKTFLHTLQGIGEGFTFEFVVVRLWNLLEESFQQVYECLDICKLFSSASAASKAKIDMDKVNNLMYTAHSSFAATLFILRGMLDVGLWGLEHGTLTVNNVNRAMRSHMIDPKKVIIRYQRLYSLWFTTARLHTSSRSQNLFVNQAAAEHTSYTLNVVDSDCFDGRHMLVTISFKSLLELIGKYATLMNSAAGTGNTGTKTGLASQSSIPIDLQDPLRAVMQAIVGRNGVANSANAAEGEREDIWLRLQTLDQASPKGDDSSMHLIAQDLAREISLVEASTKDASFAPVQLAWAKINTMDAPTKKRKIAELVTVRLEESAFTGAGANADSSTVDSAQYLSAAFSVPAATSGAPPMFERPAEKSAQLRENVNAPDEPRWQRSSRFRDATDDRVVPSSGHLSAQSGFPPPSLSSANFEGSYYAQQGQSGQPGSFHPSTLPPSSSQGDSWSSQNPASSWSQGYPGSGSARGGEGEAPRYPLEQIPPSVPLSAPSAPRPPPPRPPPMPPQMPSRMAGQYGNAGFGNAPVPPPPPSFQIPDAPSQGREGREDRESRWEQPMPSSGHPGNGFDQGSRGFGNPEARTRWQPRQ